MLKQAIRKIINATGYDIVSALPPDMDESFLSLYRMCRSYTVTSMERMFALYEATRYVVNCGIVGDIVECGVWRGGSSMLCAATMLTMASMHRKIYMYDTYEGMTEPTDKDVNYKGEKAVKDDFNRWCAISLGDVQEAMWLTGYPADNIRFVKGKVEDTIPGIMPEKIALLRLDTDFYESTYHEMVHLFPRLSPGGVLLIDDYGHFKGAREAVDKYIQDNGIKILLNRIDYTGRIGIKAGDR